jgi:hypothetical protein
MKSCKNTPPALVESIAALSNEQSLTATGFIFYLFCSSFFFAISFIFFVYLCNNSIFDF